jgi:hypothetical protein
LETQIEMTGVYEQIYSDFGKKTLELDYRTIDEFPFEKLFTIFIQGIKRMLKL